MPADPDPRRTEFGVRKVFVRWWPLWLVLIILLILLMTVLPALVGVGPAIGTGPTSTATSAAPGA
jgi:hypothetical protein